MKVDPRGYERNFMQLRKEAWKKSRTSTGFEPVTSLSWLEHRTGINTSGAKYGVYEVFLIITLNVERFQFVLADFSEVTATVQLWCLWIEHFHRFYQPRLTICNNTSEICDATVHL